MKEIKLSQGQVALVDDWNYEWLNQYKWFAVKDGNTYYAQRSIKLDNSKVKTLRMHREILNAPKGIQVDHKNGNGVDNQRDNIRLGTHQQNGANRQKQQQLTSSKYKGVSWSKKNQKWRADIKVNGKTIFLGLFNNEIKASLTYDQAALIHFGEFAKLNFPINSHYIDHNVVHYRT